MEKEEIKREGVRTLSHILYDLKVQGKQFVTNENVFKELVQAGLDENGFVEGNFAFKTRNAGDGSFVDRFYYITNKNIAYLEKDAHYDNMNPDSQEIFEDMRGNLKAYFQKRNIHFESPEKFKIL